MKTLKTFLADESGATAIEYALIAALIGLGIIGGLTAFGNEADGTFTGVHNDMQDAFDSVP